MVTVLSAGRSARMLPLSSRVAIQVADLNLVPFWPVGTVVKAILVPSHRS